MNWITKKKILTISFLFGIFSIFLGYTSGIDKCFLASNYCEDLAYVTLIFVPLFITSLFTLFIRDSAFISWRRFIIGWIPLSMILIVLVPHSPQDFLPIYKKTALMLISSILVIISLILITYKSLKKD